MYVGQWNLDRLYISEVVFPDEIETRNEEDAPVRQIAEILRKERNNIGRREKASR